jgi:hypothetical protein
MKKSIEPNACRKRQAIMSKHHTRAIMQMLFAGLIAGAAIAPSKAFAQDAPTVLGKTIGEWSAEWWKWAFAIPASTNPMLDKAGEFCHLGQQGPVWFLAGVWGGGTATRSCTVPGGKHILFSIVNAVWIQTPLDPPEFTETDWRQQANDFLPPSIGGELEATLDGNPIIFNPKTPIIRSQSPVFTASFPADNVFEADPSLLTGPIVSDGFWVMLPPLSPSPRVHELRFRAGLGKNSGQAKKKLKQDVTYHLTVANP